LNAGRILETQRINVPPDFEKRNSTANEHAAGQGNCLFHNGLRLQAACFDVSRLPPTNRPKMVAIIIATF
jgi:hypothetical protein